MNLGQAQIAEMGRKNKLRMEIRANKEDSTLGLKVRLAEARWFTKVKRGYARGWEPVQFVDRVQRYLTLLEWQPGEGVASQATRVQVGFNTGS